ncbi:MAG: hypothetical protein OEY23_21080 [Acidimicrobiia bacterium]|nr:hypothetical protein [Acidimicrobiia bacterium]
MTDGTISRDDLEQKFRQIQADVGSAAEGAQSKLVAGGVVGLLLTLALVFLLGRRAGKRKSTVVEIRRL